MIVAISIFVCTYVLIAWPETRVVPIGRPAAAMLGATAMALAGVIAPEDAYRAIDANTLVLLFALMALGVFLEDAGVFEALAERAVRVSLGPKALLACLVFSAGALSAALMNDTVCLFGTPLVALLCKRRRLPLGPYLVALATSSNIGSAATLVGNPQNILLAGMAPLSFTDYSTRVGPAVLIGLAINALVLVTLHRRELGALERAAPLDSPLEAEISWWPVVVTTAVIVAYIVGQHMALSTLVGVSVLLLGRPRAARDLFSRIDWTLIVFFAGLFVVVAGLSSTGLPRTSWNAIAPHLDLHRAEGLAAFALFIVAGSNLFSNVPLVMLVGPMLDDLEHAELAYALLGFVSTVAGNATLLGSVANLIVAERAKDDYSLGFLEYLRVGLVSTVLVLALGIPTIVWLTP